MQWQTFWQQLVHSALAAIHGLIGDGAEVIAVEPVEPFFDSYDKLLHLAGGTPEYVPLPPMKVLWFKQGVRQGLF